MDSVLPFALVLTWAAVSFATTTAAKKATSQKVTTAPKGTTTASKSRSGASAHQSSTASHSRGKYGKNYHPAHSGPSFQTAPSPERYQEIQKALAARGFFKGEANGTWGPDSVEALKEFQTSQNLPDDGKISSLSLIGLGLGPAHAYPGGVMPAAGQNPLSGAGTPSTPGVPGAASPSQTPGTATTPPSSLAPTAQSNQTAAPVSHPSAPTQSPTAPTTAPPPPAKPPQP